MKLEKEELKENADNKSMNKDIINDINEGNIKIILSIEVNDKKAIACEVIKACNVDGFIQIGIKERLDELYKKEVW